MVTRMSTVVVERTGKSAITGRTVCMPVYRPSNLRKDKINLELILRYERAYLYSDLSSEAYRPRRGRAAEAKSSPATPCLFLEASPRYASIASLWIKTLLR